LATLTGRQNSVFLGHPPDSRTHQRQQVFPFEDAFAKGMLMMLFAVLATLNINKRGRPFTGVVRPA